MLKIQSGYGRSDHERHGKGREDILSVENAEHGGSAHERHDKGERTYFLKVQTGCDVSVYEWNGNRRKDVPAEGADQVR